MNSKEKVLLNKGMDRVRRGQYADALEFFDKVLATNPENGDAWNDKGVALFRLGRTEEALEAYDKSLSLDPQNKDAMRNRGLILMSQGKFQDALETYESVLKAGGDALDMESKATALLGLGRLQEALDTLIQATKIQPMDRFEGEIAVIQEMMGKKS